jgi:hypothetical protein
VDRWHTADDLVVGSSILAREYATLSPTTLTCDLVELERLELIVKDKGRYKGNNEIMSGYLPMRKTKQIMRLATPPRRRRFGRAFGLSGPGCPS